LPDSSIVRSYDLFPLTRTTPALMALLSVQSRPTITIRWEWESCEH
jgi:hypothetical protein